MPLAQVNLFTSHALVIATKALRRGPNECCFSMGCHRPLALDACSFSRPVVVALHRSACERFFSPHGGVARDDL